MEDDDEKRTCYECKGSVFEKADGHLICVKCNHFVPDEVETICESGLWSGQTHGTNVASSRKTGKPSKEKSIPWCSKSCLKRKQEWDLYEGFNHILIKMTDAVIKCGASPKVKKCVYELWATYLCKLKVAFYENVDQTSNLNTVDNEDSIIPDWFSQTSTQQEKEEVSEKKKLMFAPPKMPYKTYKKKRSKEEDLSNVPDINLSGFEKRKKKRQIRDSYLKLAVSGADTDVSVAESLFSVETVESNDIMSRSRLSSIKDMVPERFPENIVKIETLTTKKTEKFMNARSVYADPEYLTLYKLLSFVHAALVLKGELIFYSDLIRWIREGFVPLYGAHRLLPSSMPLSHDDAKVLGGVSTAKSKGTPSTSQLRQNTSRLLSFLGIKLVPKPPTILLASKIIRDLQLPNELTSCITCLDEIIMQSNVKQWRLSTFGLRVDTGNIYAAVLILITLKLIFGLDGTTEYEMSNFAQKINELLNLKPSSSFTRGNLDRNADISFSSMRTLFVWEEWVRFIRHRSYVLERTHVPTAIRKGTVRKMDPQYIIHFVKNEGKSHLNVRGYETGLKSQDEQIQQIVEQFSTVFPSSSQKKIPIFRPSLLGIHGLAEQLIEFDSSEYGLLKQEFSTSSLAYALEPVCLAEALGKINPPYELKVCLGPAYSNVHLTYPFVSSRKGKLGAEGDLSEADRHGVKVLKLNPLVESLSSSYKKEKQVRPSLLMFQPSAAYWSRSVLTKDGISKIEWEVLSSQLPATFLWTLKLISDAINESPEALYCDLAYVESILTLGYGDVKHTLRTKAALKRHLVGAMKKEL